MNGEEIRGVIKLADEFQFVLEIGLDFVGQAIRVTPGRSFIG